MNRYNYPVRYFHGAGLEFYSRELIEGGLAFFNEKHAVKAPIVGESGIDGVKLDFNCGLRLQIPRGDWHVRIVDAASDYIFIDENLSSITLISIEKYFVNWEIALWLDGEPVFYHRFDPTEQSVHFHFSKATLGDTIALLPYVEAFGRRFDCRVTCSIPEVFHGIVERYFPTVRLTSGLPDDSYACFYMQPVINLPFAATEDSLSIPLLRVGHSILRRVEQPPKVIYRPTKPREIVEPYVCIGVQASTTTKGWLNPGGWDRVVEYLRSIGYRVLCIDRERRHADAFNVIEQPSGVEDMSGDYDLLERVNQLAYADFFIGLGSGLSWLAWTTDIPVILISGISARWCEFDTPYRIDNPLVCHGCFNACRDYNKLGRCSLFEGTDRAYECSKKISARSVIDAIERLMADRNLIGGK